MPQDPWTIGRLLQWTADYLRRRGAPAARLDAEVLLASVRGCDRIDLYTAYEEVPPESVRAAFRRLVRRRADGTPVAYLVGRREFYSLIFRVTEDVLIPRPETELVVTALLDLIRQRDHGTGPTEVADVGTGSGIIAVCAAKFAPRCRVTATDVSAKALEVARSNARRHGVADRVEFVRGDLLADVNAARRFDFIASNPPYVAEAELKGLAREVRDHEPKVALVAGVSGTEVIARLVPQAADRLEAGGRLVMEVSPMIHGQVVEMLAADGRFEPAATVKDLARLPRVVVAERRET